MVSLEELVTKNKGEDGMETVSSIEACLHFMDVGIAAYERHT